MEDFRMPPHRLEHPAPSLFTRGKMRAVQYDVEFGSETRFLSQCIIAPTVGEHSKRALDNYASVPGAAAPGHRRIVQSLGRLVANCHGARDEQEREMKRDPKPKIVVLIRP